jgi:hypothetical protein
MGTEQQQDEASAIPDRVVKSATNIVNDSKKVILVAFIPILALAFMGRVVEWYLLRRKCPRLGTEDSELARSFRSALLGLWVGALCWPIIIALVLLVLFALSG